MAILDGHCRKFGRDPEDHSAQRRGVALHERRPGLPEEDARRRRFSRPRSSATVDEIREIVAQYQAIGVDELIVPDFTLGPTAAEDRDARSVHQRSRAAMSKRPHRPFRRPRSCCCAATTRSSKCSWWCATTRSTSPPARSCFPGGKVDPQDDDPALAALLRRRVHRCRRCARSRSPRSAKPTRNAACCSRAPPANHASSRGTRLADLEPYRARINSGDDHLHGVPATTERAARVRSTRALRALDYTGDDAEALRHAFLHRRRAVGSGGAARRARVRGLGLDQSGRRARRSRVAANIR